MSHSFSDEQQVNKKIVALFQIIEFGLKQMSKREFIHSFSLINKHRIFLDKGHHLRHHAQRAQHHICNAYVSLPIDETVLNVI